MGENDMESQRVVRNILPNEIDGYKKSVSGCYVPKKETLIRMFESFKVKPEEVKKYVPDKDHLGILRDIEICRKLGKPILLVGPTGVGKTLLARNVAARLGMPFIRQAITADLTDHKARGGVSMRRVPIELDGQVMELTMNQFSPSNLSLIAMSGLAETPVVGFEDEMHNVREGVTPLFHAMTNERELPCIELSGEIYEIHRDTLQMAALNPEYGDEGIDRLDAALRRRYMTIDFKMPTGERLKKVVTSNLSNQFLTSSDKMPEIEPSERKSAEREKILDRTLNQLTKAVTELIIHRAAEGEGGGRAIDENGDDVNTGLQTEELNAFIENPSPAHVVNAMELFKAGMRADSAIDYAIVNTTVNNFGPVRNAIATYFGNKITAY